MILGQVVYLENETKSESASELTKAISDNQVRVLGFYTHSKASEKYVVISIARARSYREWVLPYQYRRTNTFIDDRMGLIELIRKAKLCLSESNIVAFKARIKPQVKKIFGAGATVTIPIFLRLLNHCGEWVCNKVFHNENPQRRIQDIKESGFTLVTKFESGRKTYHMLLPFDPI